MELFLGISFIALFAIGFVWALRVHLRDMDESLPKTVQEASVKASTRQGNTTSIYGCPTCLSEYEPEIELCPDCKIKLGTIPNWTKPE